MKGKLHKRNKHHSGYNFETLVKANTSLEEHVELNPNGQSTINFSNALAVKELNKAILLADYNLEYWDLPNGHLCPPIPGRVDYIHYVADLLFESKDQNQIKSYKVKGLDIGTGANLIYPILGWSEYNWQFVCSEVNLESINWAKEILSKNPALSNAVKIRRQKNKKHILKGLIQSQEHFDFTICNPPFHTSEEEALKSNQIKSKKLKIKENLNFGGVHSELWCEGGEVQFIETLLSESQQHQSRVLWFTCLVSKKESLETVLPKFKANKHIKQFKIVDMAQGQKKSRFIAWTFQTEKQISAWKRNKN